MLPNGYRLRQPGTSVEPTEIAVFTFAMLFPMVFTFLYFEWLAPAGGVIQLLAYSIGKTLQFSLPILWFGLVCHRPWRLRRFNPRGLLEGFLFGATIFVVMVGLYFLWFRLPNMPLAPGSLASQSIHEKLSNLQFATPLRFILVGVFYCVIHSGLEEYYWRFFVFRFGKQLTNGVLGGLLSSVGFTLHHIVILGNFFGYTNPWGWFFSFCVGVGGAYWCWLYHRSDSIYGPWISHAVIDAAIFTIGYVLLFG